MSMRRALFRSLLVMTASLSVAGAASLSATAAPTTKAQFGPTSTIIAVGAAVQVRVVYTCQSTDKSPAVSATVTERVPGGMVQGNGSAPSNTVTCDGRPRAVQFGVATSNNFPFGTGVAFATGDLSATLSNGTFTDFSFAGVFSIP
jgi:hypothetical protein